MKNKLLILVALFAASAGLMAGNLKGVVKSKDTGTTLPNAVIHVMGTEIRALADVDGSFEIKNLADGAYKVRATFSGFAAGVMDVNIAGDTNVEFKLSPSSIDEEITVTANRAVVRETPVAFSNVTGDDIKGKYTNQDAPELLKSVPGVFSRSAGMGETELFVRGFDAEHVQIMINNVPVNDPESQKVYWSNWTGLSGNANSIQVQRGVGSSLYGSGAFGGSVNIETDNFSVQRSYSFSGAYGSYGGASDNSNFNVSFDYSTGFFNEDKMNFYFRYERKDGESYIDGTDYDGHSYYFGFLYQLNDRNSLTFNFHGAPQKHNQAGNVQDPEFLIKQDGTLYGRTWNRRHHPYQENYYHKPVFEIHHEWIVSTDSFWRSTFFATTGEGGGRYLRNDRLIETQEQANEYGAQIGEVVIRNGYTFKPNRNYDPGSGMYSNSWKNDSQNDHVQWGANTSFKKVFSPALTLVTGGEVRFWEADHYSQSKNFEFGDEGPGKGAIQVEEVERRYDYTGETTNASVYARLQYSPIPEQLTFMFDVQYNLVEQSVTENAVRQYDFYNRQWTDIYARTTRDIINNWTHDEDGNLLTTQADVIANPEASADRYERDYDFLQPKFGVNYNINENWNVFANYSEAKKEPKVGDWFPRHSVPKSEDELKEEDLTDLELGFGYHSANVAFTFNYYMLTFENKIQSVTDNNGDRETLNAGNADMNGLELSFKWMVNDNFTWSASYTGADNEWTAPNSNIDVIFFIDADEIVGKKVPGSPQTMFFTELAYTEGNFFGYLNYNFWDDYYTTYDNTNVTYKGVTLETLNDDSTLPAFSEVGLGLGYNFELDGGSALRLVFRVDNLTGHKHYNNASVRKDYGRLSSGPYLGVVQAAEETFWLNLSWRF
ncbi:MAG: hypothetical protein CR997_00915 [Acidobacteria bacterium]|nr:MAG: hypothetical protein CR997_00915 [Acidobacteriota bacterium]